MRRLRPGKPRRQAEPETRGVPTSGAIQRLRVLQDLPCGMEERAPYLPVAGQPYALTQCDYQGESLKVDFSHFQGVSGCPTYNGWISLEHNPDLVPFLARGSWSTPGKFYRQAVSTPQVGAALDPAISAIVAAPYTVTATKLPPWASQIDKDVQSKHLEFCQRMLLSWPRNKFRAYLREVLWTAMVMGFYLGEITAQRDKFGYLMPNLPKWRAPWAVQRWITQLDDLRGVEFNFGGTDSWGRTTESGKNRIIIPKEKLMHVVSNQIGNNFEGISFLRPISVYIDMLADAMRVWALANEVNAVGTMVGTEDPSATVDLLAVLKEQLGNYSAVDIPFFALPSGAKIEHISPQSQLPDLSAYILILERFIAMSLGNSHQLIALQGAGSFAARKDGSEESREAWRFLGDTFINNPIETQLFERFLRINFPEDVAAGRLYVPQLGVQNILTEDVPAIVKSTIEARDSGLLEDPILGPHFREKLGLPSEVK